MHTIDTIMKPISNLRVHIAPVGFEVDRIVISAKQMKADKVWLLIHNNPSEDKAGPFIEKIQKQLKKEKIKFSIERHNRLDLFNIIKSIKEIVSKEEGNDIYVNLASGSKIQAIASMMACMMFNEEKRIKPFYAEAERYSGFEGNQMSFGVKNLMQIPTYEIHTPKTELIETLRIIINNKGRIRKKEMAKLAEKNNLIIVNAREENYTQARFASLDKNIIQPLVEQWKFVEVEKIGRTRWVKITQEGINAAEFLL